MSFNTQYPMLSDLKKKSRRRIPSFAYEYMIGGCVDEVGLADNHKDLKQIKLKQRFLRDMVTPDVSAQLCGIKYDAPIGVAPVGLQGLIWPNAPIILAKAAAKYNVPYVLSTVSTASIEQVAKASEGQALFQLYNPAEPHMRQDILKRAQDAGYRALFVTIDVASFGYRPRDIRNGLGMPPKMYLKNIISMLSCPTWGIKMLLAGGIPTFPSLKPYMKGRSIGELASFMNDKMTGVVTLEDLKKIRDQWKGPIILKGIMDASDVEKGIELGIEGMLVSNHGARQLDGGQSSISVLPELVRQYGNKVEFSFDSGIESGSDIACAIASGAKFTFSGRAFMHGLGALGNQGGEHTIEMFKRQLAQSMTQMGANTLQELPDYLANNTQNDNKVLTKVSTKKHKPITTRTRINKSKNADPQEINKIRNRIPNWKQKPHQVNSQILQAYFDCKKSHKKLLRQDLCVYCEEKGMDKGTFLRNFNQMIMISKNNHGKIFDKKEDGEVVLWEPAAEYIKKVWQSK